MQTRNLIVLQTLEHVRAHGARTRRRRRGSSPLRMCVLQRVCAEQSRCAVQKTEVTQCLALIESVPVRGLWLMKECGFAAQVGGGLNVTLMETQV